MCDAHRIGTCAVLSGLGVASYIDLKHACEVCILGVCEAPLPGYYSIFAPTGQQQHSRAETAAQDEGIGKDEASETSEQYLMRRTREFNVATRERPHDLQLWLDFAAYQDVLGGCGLHKLSALHMSTPARDLQTCI